MSLRKESKSLVLALIVIVAMMLMVVGSGFAQSAGGCQDAAGGSIPCTATPEPPPDRDGDGVSDVNDACPDQPGQSVNNGCAIDQSTPTSEPSTNPNNSPNPLRPPSDGVCQVSAATTFGANVRAQPSLSAPEVALLDPLQLYVVFNIVLNSEGTWYRVEAGWVNSTAVTLGGQCPARIVAAGPSGFSIPQEAYDQTTAGIIFPETKCFEIFNGMRLCQIVLSAVADDGSTEGTVPWNITTCGFGPGGVVCILNEFTAFTEDECLPEFCEPPQGDPLPPGFPNPEGTEGQAGSCEALLNDLAASSGTPHYTVFQPDGSTAIGLRLPPVDPDPCRQNIYLLREENAANGLIPVDVLTVEIDLPPGAEIDIESWSLGDQSSTTAGHVKVFDGRGGEFADVVCIAIVPGDFRLCPGQPSAPLDLATAPTPEPPISVADMFASVPPPDPGTAYVCITDPEDINCYCNSGSDCADLFSNACFGETMLCEGEICGCSYPNDPD